MRKIVLVFMLFVSVFMTSCFEDAPILNTHFLDMRFEERARLYIDNMEHNDVVRWRSSNEFVVTVSRDGLVTANHVGEAYISAFVGGDELICDVVVDPLVDLYEEPILAFGKSKSYILNEEWRGLIQETATSLWFEDIDVDFYMYMFRYNRLVGAGVTLNPRRVISSDLDLFLDERYQFVGYDKDVAVFERDYFGVDVYSDKVGIRVEYYELQGRVLNRETIINSDRSEEAEVVLKELRQKLSL